MVPNITSVLVPFNVGCMEEHQFASVVYTEILDCVDSLSVIVQYNS